MPATFVPFATFVAGSARLNAVTSDLAALALGTTQRLTTPFLFRRRITGTDWSGRGGGAGGGIPGSIWWWWVGYTDIDKRVE